MTKKILLIATGGTIASKHTEAGLAPAISSAELLEYVPEIKNYCEISSCQMFNLDSTNMRPEYWLGIAKKIRAEYENYDGFVITHGTDTMAYASAMLYYLIQNSPKPVVLTGSQISIDERDTDARENLLGAVIYACDESACGVHIFFNGKVICGNRARKTRTKSLNAFSSIDFPEVAFIRGKTVHYYIREDFKGPVRFYDEINTAVAVVKMTPGMASGIFDYVAENCAAIIVESFGVGGLPYYENDEFSGKIEELVSRGVKIIMTTQVAHEGSDLEVYSVGFRIKKRYELLESYDMTTEAVVAKTMWALGAAKNDMEFRSLFTSKVGNDRI